MARNREEGDGLPLSPVVSVPEVRDYTRINAAVLALLNSGHREIRLSGVDGQRLLLHDLRGTWSARIDVEGDAGPELAAQMDAPGVVVVCHGSAADGAARGLVAGGVMVAGRVSSAVGYAMRGGCVMVRGDAGTRAGLEMRSGAIFIEGNVDRLAADRQQGGLMVIRGAIGPFSGLGRIGGRLLTLAEATEGDLAPFREAFTPIIGGLPFVPDSD